MPEWLQAGAFGLLGGAALLLGAAVSWFAPVPRVVVATVMAFGAGVLISAVAFDLMDEAERTGGLLAAGSGFLGGAVAYVGADAMLSRRGARQRKRAGDEQPSEDDTAGSGTAIALGALLDGVPESVVLGASLVGGGSVSVSVLTAVFVSNVPEGLSSVAGMRNAGRSGRYVFGVWGGIAVASGLAAALGYTLLADAPGAVLAVIMAVAAGAILAMVCDTMIPEAFEQARVVTGLIAVLGFLVAFVIGRA